MKTWSEPFNRPPRYRVRSGDIPEALKEFGPEVKTLMVNPSVLPEIEEVIPAGIELLPHPGCAAWEIFGDTLTQEYPFTSFPQDIKVVEVEKPIISKIPDTQLPADNYEIPDNTPLKRGRGRPRKDGPVSSVTLWRRRKEILKQQERMI